MDLAHRPTTLRKNRGLTQLTLADTVRIHINQIRRYEAGTNRPTLDELASIRARIEGALLRHQARRLFAS